jgi:conjugative relaxase-like TrwC/TraI family protein
MLGMTGRSDWRYLVRHAEEGRHPEGRPAREPRNYYAEASNHGEPPGLWWGEGATALGLEGEVDHDVMHTLYGGLVAPATGEALGSRPRQFATYQERLAAKLTAEPDATPERRRELEFDAAKSHRKAVHYFDLTFSMPKSWSVVHAAYEKAGRHEDAAKLWESYLTGVDAGLRYIEREAGYSRAGYHATTTAGRTSGRWVDGHDFVVSLWRHHTSRDGDPQLHVHAAVLNRVLNDDGVWRSLDSNAIAKARRAADSVAMRAAEADASERLGLEFRSRPDGVAREIVGVDKEVNDLFSTRRRVIKGELKELVAAYEERYSTAPSAYRLSLMSEQVTLKTRARKPDHPPTRAELLDAWEARMRTRFGESLDTVLEQVDDRRLAPRAPGTFDPELVVADSLAAVQNRKAVWNRHDLRVEIDRHLPDYLDAVGYAAVQNVIDELTDQALQPNGEAVKLTAPELIPTPDELRRADGRSLYEPHDGDRFATKRQLTIEERLVAAAREDGAPKIEAGRAEQLVRATSLAGSQADAVKTILSSGKRLEVAVGYAGAGKSFAMAQLAEIWENETGNRVFGLAVAERARQVLAEEGITRGANVEKWLIKHRAAVPQLRRDRELIEALGPKVDAGTATAKQLAAYGQAAMRIEELSEYELRDGDMVIIDEGSMVGDTDLDQIREAAARAGARVVIAGDDRQLSAVESGTAMRLIAQEVGAHEITEVRRFKAEWEREASVGLRAGDAASLIHYDRHGRLLEGTAEEMTETAYRGYLADLLDDRQSLLIVPTNEQAAELSSKVRDELVRLGRVERDGIELHNATVAGRGDLIQLRRNNNDVRDKHEHPLINREVYEVTGHKGDDLIVRRLLGTDDYGKQRYAPQLRLPTSYVREHVELAYASTTHSAQGRTVDTAHSVVDSQMSREALYVDLTRGVDANVAYVITDVPETDGQDPDRSNRFAVLSSILEKEGAQQSATEVRREELEASESLARLEPIWADRVGQEYASRYEKRLREVAGDELASTVAADDAASALWRRMRSAELAGADVDQVIRDAVEQRELDSADSVAEVLAWRVDRQLSDAETAAPKSYVERTPERDDPIGAYTRQLAQAMDRRVEELGNRITDERPEWATKQLGPVPEDPLERMAWSERAGEVAAYREAYGYHREDDAIGPAPGRGNVEARAAWDTAYGALAAPEDERLIAARDDAELRNLISDYGREEAWAPAYVDDELREANLAGRDYHTQLVLERAELDTAHERSAEERAQAAQRLADLEALNERLDKRAADLDEIAQARSAWYAETARARELADQARNELRRRGVDVAEEQVRDKTAGVDRDERQEPTPAVSEEHEISPEQREGRELASHEAERAIAPEQVREERAETRMPAEERVRDETAGVDRDEHQEPTPVVSEEHEISPEQDDKNPAAREPEREGTPPPAPEVTTESRVQAELQRAREATEILAERQAERHRAEVEAEAERGRDYPRRLGDDPDYEHEYHHEVDDHVADVRRTAYEE